MPASSCVISTQRFDELLVGNPNFTFEVLLVDVEPWLIRSPKSPAAHSMGALRKGLPASMPRCGQVAPGREKRTVVPCPGPSLATVMVPAWAVTMARAIASPRPEPPVPRVRDRSAR